MTANFTPPGPLNTAVLFLVFNRPDTTAQVFEEIRKARPPRLYIAADGPRQGRDAEAERVANVREIVTTVDWSCEVKTLFRNDNLGCKRAVGGAITWFFEQEEQGIILEDDCLPSQSFFWFCEDLLNNYKNNEKISMISGYNKQNEWKADQCDYFFSHFGGIWGWASWNRAWAHYDMEMKQLDEMSRQNQFVRQMGRRLGGLRERQLNSAKRKIQSGEIDTWDYPWALSRHVQAGLACVPSKSLIQNIGFGLDATHTIGPQIDNVVRHQMNLPLHHTSIHAPDMKYDKLFISQGSLLTRIKRKLKMLGEGSNVGWCL